MASNAIAGAYESVVLNKTNWLLLHYESDNYDDLSFYADGYDGLEELKTKIYDLDRVFVALYRMETEVGPGYILLNYIPPKVSGVKRARALVHSRRVGVIMKKHQAVLTVENLSQLTSSSIHRALVDPSFTAPSPMGHSFSHSPAPPTIQSTLGPRRPKPITLDMPRRSFSETYAPHVRTPQAVPPLPPLPQKPSSPGVFVGIFRRMKDSHSDDRPPPIPQKDLPPIPQGEPAPPPRVSPPKMIPVAKQKSAPPPLKKPSKQPSPPASLSEDFAVISPFEIDGYSFTEEPISIPMPRPATNGSQFRPPPLPSKWAKSRENLLSDPEERERRRLERLRHKEQEELQAQEEEERKKEEKRRQREEEKKREEEEEKRRKAEMKERLQKIAEEKKIKRRMEEEEEQRKRREIEERKRIDREKRLEEHRKLEQWRKEQERIREDEAKKAALEKKREQETRQRKIEEAEKVLVHAQSEIILTGYVTIQFPDSLFWKRRYFKFMDSTLNLYRSPKDMDTALEIVELRGQVKALKEWSDGYEDLEAIPFSFVIEFNDRTWSVFTDSEEDKFRVLALLKRSSGL